VVGIKGLTAAASDLLDIALRFEGEFGEAFDEDSPINAGQASTNLTIAT
jgi:hypothetical protein